jgi:hypothetical protein
MEYWASKADDGLFFFQPGTIHIKTDLIPPKPVLQHSIIATCPAEVTPRSDEGGYSMAFIYGKANLL